MFLKSILKYWFWIFLAVCILVPILALVNYTIVVKNGQFFPGLIPTVFIPTFTVVASSLVCRYAKGGYKVIGLFVLVPAFLALSIVVYSGFYGV
ncbi:hypothetical protein [Aliikangiella sp. IMCC44359]|uniref:hypothetical protein n=1 Tax=Aliikangiella sp. IMCC44359 TaxID=3459125 RepID=UPI00403AD770